MKISFEADDIVGGMRLAHKTQKGVATIMVTTFHHSKGGGYAIVNLVNGYTTQWRGSQIGDDRPFTREEVAAFLTANEYIPVTG